MRPLILSAATLATFIVFSGVPALADDGDTMRIMYCVDGSGCWIGKSDLTAESVQVLLGDRAPSGTSADTDIIVLKDNAPARIVGFTPEEINAVYGGSGEPGAMVISPGDTTLEQPIIVFTPEDIGTAKEIALFEQARAAEPSNAAPEGAAPGGTIVPLDGSWSAKLRENSFSQCGETIESMFSGALAQANATPRIHNIIWNGTFHPDKLNAFNEKGQIAEWSQVAPNRFEGRVFRNDMGGQLDMAIGTSATLLAPDHIESRTTMSMASLAPESAAALEQLGAKDCVIISVFDLRRSGD